MLLWHTHHVRSVPNARNILSIDPLNYWTSAFYRNTNFLRNSAYYWTNLIPWNSLQYWILQYFETLTCTAYPLFARNALIIWFNWTILTHSDYPFYLNYPMLFHTLPYYVCMYVWNSSLYRLLLICETLTCTDFFEYVKLCFLTNTFNIWNSYYNRLTTRTENYPYWCSYIIAFLPPKKHCYVLIYCVIVILFHS